MVAEQTTVAGRAGDVEKSWNVHSPKLAMLMIVLSAIINSSGGILVRSLEAANEWQVVFWRGLALGAAIMGIMFFQHRWAAFNEIRRIGRLGFIGGVFYSGALICYLLALTHTTIANAVFTLSAIPFFTALIAWLVLGERVRARTAIAIAAALAGIALMVGDGIATGSVFGNVMALVAAVCFSCFVVVLRKGRAVNMLPATGVGALLAALIAAFMIDGDYLISGQDLAICLIWGGVISSVAHFLVVNASRCLSGAVLTLIILIEFVLSPIWVWLFVNEVPSAMTLIGGAVVLSAVAGHALASMRQDAPPRAAK